MQLTGWKLWRAVVTSEKQEKEKILERENKSMREPDIIRRDRMCAARERNLLISRHEKESMYVLQVLPLGRKWIKTWPAQLLHD